MADPLHRAAAYRSAEKYILQNFANFSRTVETYNKKFHTLVTHSPVRKSEEFRYIINRIDKITLLLIVATGAMRGEPHLAESAAPSGSSRLNSSMNYGSIN